jgi:hypothetical protein
MPPHARLDKRMAQHHGHVAGLHLADGGQLQVRLTVFQRRREGELGNGYVEELRFGRNGRGNL